MSVLDKINAVPTHIFILPSTGEEIKFRPFIHKEEKVLMLAKESGNETNYMQALKDIISTCSFGKLNPDEMATFDIEEFFLRLRGASVGQNVNLSLVCQHPELDEEGNLIEGKICGHENPITVNLADIEVDRELIKQNKFIVQLNEEVSVEMRYPNYDTFEKLMILREDPEADIDVSDVLTDMVRSIFTKDEIFPATDMTTEEIKAFIDRLTSQQIENMLEVLRNTPTVAYDVAIQCEACGREITYNFRGVYDFFD